MRTTRFEPSPCPTCGKVVDFATHPTEDVTPSPGDATICFGCQDILVFAEDLTLRTPTADELGQLPLLEISRYQRALTAIKS